MAAPTRTGDFVVEKSLAQIVGEAQVYGSSGHSNCAGSQTERRLGRKKPLVNNEERSLQQTLTSVNAIIAKLEAEVVNSRNTRNAKIASGEAATAQCRATHATAAGVSQAVYGSCVAILYSLSLQLARPTEAADRPDSGEGTVDLLVSRTDCKIPYS